ncbi:SpoIIE family protein phosphatase [Pseudomonadota bacterium]
MAKNQQKVILAVDDNPEILELIEILLSQEHMVKTAISGKDALKIAKEQAPDLILLDVMMPEMDGYEVYRQLKEIPSVRDVPIIFITTMGEVKEEVKGLELGAVDYLTKPISMLILQARVNTHLALKLAREELQAKNWQLEQERQLVEDVVVRMRTDLNFDERHLRTAISPVEATCGDLILSAFCPDGHQRVLVGDFTGHGLPAAIGGPLVSYLFYSMTADGYPTDEVLKKINSVIQRQLPTQQFMVAAMVEITSERDSLTLWSAALPDCLLVRGDGATSHHISQNMPLGIIDNIKLGEGEKIALSPTDRFYMFSDGLMEVMNEEQEMFGYPRLEKLLIECAIHGRSLESILDQVNDFRSADEQPDDFTLVELSP